MKKILSLFLVALMLVLAICPAGAVDASSAKTLQFNKDGKFKICVIADPQDGHPTNEAMLEFINEALDKNQPDLVVFLGDNITKDAENIESYDELLTPLTSRNIPFTLVFGNHEDAGLPNIGKEGSLEIFKKYDGCLAYDDDPSLHGVGNHNLPILSSDGTKTAFNLWMLDSGDYLYDDEGTRIGYDCVRKDQLEWYKNKSADLKEQNGGEQVPSIMFQHIVCEEVISKLFIPFVGINPGFKVDEDFNDHTRLGFPFKDGKTYTMIPNLGNLHGFIYEMGCPSFENDGQWDCLAENGDVLAVVTGHDHKSDFVINDIKGIDAIQVPAATYAKYHDLSITGVKIIELDENNLWEYSAYTDYAFDYALSDGSKLAGLDGVSKKDYQNAKLKNHFLGGLMKVLNVVFYLFKFI